MDNFNDLKAIWQTANTSSLPVAAGIMKTVKNYRDKTLRKKAMAIAISCIMAVLGTVSIFFFPLHLISTRVGELCIIIACGILAFTNIRSVKRFYQLQDCSNVEFIRFLQKTQQNQDYYYRNTQVAGMAFITVGLLLFVFEPIHQNLWLCVFGYAVIFIYLSVIWFIVRPRMFKKNSAGLTWMIERAEKLSKQLEE